MSEATELKPATKAALARLEATEFFRAVGQVDTDEAIVVGSWDEAIRNAQTLAWENLRISASNVLGSRVRAISKERLSMWNQHVDLINPHLSELLEVKVKTKISEGLLPKGIDIEVDYDLCGLFLELEYSDVVKPGFYFGLSYWYERGRFPCGWHGEPPPNGRLMVY